MTKLYVSEYPGLAETDQSDSTLIVAMPPIAEQIVDYTAGVATLANPFSPFTKFIYVSTDAICSIAFGVTPVATITNLRLAANERILTRVVAGQKVSAITNT